MKSVVKTLGTFLVCMFLFIAEPVQAQCPMCKAAVESSVKSGQSNAGKGLNNGILYLLAAPYLFVGVLGFVWYKRYRVRAKVNVPDEHIIMN
jgi:hypothetical protein